MVYDTYNYSYWGLSKPIYNWGAPHCKSFPKEWTNSGVSGLNKDLQAELFAHFLQGSSNGANYATGDDEPLGMTRNDRGSLGL